MTMSSLKLLSKRLLALSLVTALGSVSASFADAPKGAINLKLNSFKEVTVTAEDGTQTTRLESIETAIPGDTIVYVTEFANVSDKTVDAGATIKSLIPKNTVFVAGSMVCDSCSATFSVDAHSNAANATFKQASDLVIAETDGSTRVATASDYTLIQWQLNDAIDPATSGSLTYKVKIKRNTLSN